MIHYFGFGANRDNRMIEALIGRSIVGVPALLNGYRLCVQSLPHIPDTIVPTAPVPVSPRAVIAENWPPEFESYGVRPARAYVVAGTIWALTHIEREIIRDWELVDFGWSEDVSGEAVTLSGARVPVVTEQLRANQLIDRTVDTYDYPNFLHPVSDFVRVATKCRSEFLERVF
jgi:hypothetical protein